MKIKLFGREGYADCTDNRKCSPPSAKYPKIHSASAQMGGNGFSRNALRPFLMSINPCGLKPRQVNTFAEWIYGHKTTEQVVQRNYFWPFGPSEARICEHLAEGGGHFLLGCCHYAECCKGKKSPTEEDTQGISFCRTFLFEFKRA